MSALSTLQHNAPSKEQFTSNDIETARNSQNTTTSQSPLQTTDGSALPPVDGGIKAWSVIGGAFLALFVQFGLGEFTGSFESFSVPPDSPPTTAHIRIARYYVSVWTSRLFSMAPVPRDL